MKTTKTTITAYGIELSENRTHVIIGYAMPMFYVKNEDGITLYLETEMRQIYRLNDSQIENIKSKLA